jgi:hypothetical protein
MVVVISDVGEDHSRQIRLGDKFAAVDHPALEDAKPDLDLVQPAAMLRREMYHVIVIRIGQERAPLRSRARLVRLEPNTRQPGDEVRVDVVVANLDVPFDDPGKLGGTGFGRIQLSLNHHQGIQSAPSPA